MLALDSLIIDLVFRVGAAPKPETLVAALGGDDVAAARTILDPDIDDPRIETQLSPTVPMRRRGERRLLIIDDSVAPMRQDPRTDPIVPIDLRAEKARLIRLVSECEGRLGRLSALGTWGDAVIVARSARDLRAVALLSWALDPGVDVQGRQRANRLTRPEFEEKLLAFDKRLEELDDQAIIAGIRTGKVERHGDVIVVDVLEPDGTWDVRNSLALEYELAALDRFALIPGAPVAAGTPDKNARAAGATAGARPAAAAAKGGARPAAATPTAPATPATPATPARAPASPPLTSAEVDGRVVVIFPTGRFDLDTAAALGKQSWQSVLAHHDQISRELRERLDRDGGAFIAPLEFLSEVFLDGKPLSRPTFDAVARAVGDARAADVHCPRFGPVTLIDDPARGRFITSAVDHVERVIDLLPAKEP